MVDMMKISVGKVYLIFMGGILSVSEQSSKQDFLSSSCNMISCIFALLTAWKGEEKAGDKAPF